MKNVSYSLILAICLCLYGCLGPLTETYYFYESLVSVYENVDYSEEVEVERVSSFPHRVVVRIPTETYARYTWDSTPERWKQDNPDWELWHERHRELSQKNGDVGFNKNINDTDGCAFHYRVWNTDNLITSISIVSNTDFDENHPAGTLLDDVIAITYVSYKSIIENNYTLPEGVGYGNCGYDVTKLLSEFESEDSRFMASTVGGYGNSFWLKFVQDPTLAMQHTFTVTIEFEHGEPYSFTFDLDLTPTIIVGNSYRT